MHTLVSKERSADVVDNGQSPCSSQDVEYILQVNPTLGHILACSMSIISVTSPSGVRLLLRILPLRSA